MRINKARSKIKKTLTTLLTSSLLASIFTGIAFAGSGIDNGNANGGGAVNAGNDPVTYSQQSVKALGNWEQQGSTWKFKCLDGSYLSNAWIESLSEAGAYYFLGTDGTMLLNSKTPDGYEVDGAGLWRAGVTGNNVDIDSSVNSAESKYETRKTTGRAEERLSQEYINFVKEHADTLVPSYGGLN